MNEKVLEKPLVSIVLPTYNRAHVLPYAVSSVLQQTHRNLELIIVDDNSSDNTRRVVNGFCDERIRYVRNGNNLKLPGALNKGFSLSRGIYLTWTSDDNMYLENAIERMVEFVETKGCDFVYADYFHFAEVDPETGRPVDGRHEKLRSKVELEKSNHIGACFLYTRGVYRKVGEYDPDLFLVEDYDYFIRIAKLFEMCHIPEPLYFFRRNGETLYCSRFNEVKAADVLVRYKNGLLDKDDALNAIVTLITKNIEAMNNWVVRRGFYVVRRASYRLTNIYRNGAAKYLRHKLRKEVMDVLESYDAKRRTFQEARECTSQLMSRVARIGYKV